ncbi:MAG TPA: arginase family protein [Thermomicrobiales bacterium]|nr:arginase family protein [Thermomicrobiales bacterium]
MSVQIVTVPYRYDEPHDGLGLGPDALLRAGLRQRLKAMGIDTGEPVAASLSDDEREDGKLAVNIGKLGRDTASKVASAVETRSPVVVLAGDDTAAIGVLSGLQQTYGAGANIGLVWLDAHADFNTPETSYSGILAGMPVAILAGLAGPLWREAAQLRAPLSTDRILLAGVRDMDEKEEILLRSTDVRILTANEIRTSSTFENAVDRFAMHVDFIALHVDLDLLDPSLVPSASTPSPNGLSIRQATRLVKYVIATGKTAVLTVTSLNPGAGDRGTRSVQSALTLLENTLGSWTGIGGEADADA